MTNNEKFNVLLNSCRDPRQIYNALMALATPTPNPVCVSQETARARLFELGSKLEEIV